MSQKYICTRLHVTGSHCRNHFAHRNTFKGNRCRYQKLFSHQILRSVHLIFQLQSMFLHIRSHFYRFQIHLRYIFTPYRFPDTCCLHIPTAKIFVNPALLSSWLLHIKGILHFHNKLIFPVFQQRTDIKIKSGISPSMASCILTIDPYFCNKIASLKVNHIIILLQFPCIYLNLPSVPDIIMASLIPNPTHFRLISKRNLNRQISFEPFIPSFFFATVFVVKCKIPGSIKIFPVFSLKLRSRIILYITLNHTYFPPLFHNTFCFSLS